jgi:uncharacterized YkwD family protein
VAVKKVRWLAGLLAAICAASVAGPAARASGAVAPWFGEWSGAVPEALKVPLQMTARYVSFWLYVDGIAWAQYQQMRLAGVAAPASYLARASAPLPELADAEEPPEVMEEEPAVVTQAPAAPLPGALPDEPAAYMPEPAPEPEPDPAPDPKPDPIPAPTPAPAPTPKPDPAPAPKPDPAPAPKPGPAPAPAPTPGLAAAEQQMLDLINGERTAAGLTPLTADLRLVATARAKSQDMITGNYFDHNSPTLGSPFDQLRAAGITYRTAGENLAGNQSVQAAHTALMNSAGHRANILSTRFTKIGIGIIEGGRYGMMFTQQFIGE